MTQAVTYERETKSVAFQGKIIVLESLTPSALPRRRKNSAKKRLSVVLRGVLQIWEQISLIIRNYCCPGAADGII